MAEFIELPAGWLQESLCNFIWFYEDCIGGTFHLALAVWGFMLSQLPKLSADFPLMESDVTPHTMID